MNASIGLSRKLAGRWRCLAAALSLGWCFDGHAAEKKGFLDWWLDRDVQVITVTDKTPEGRRLREPTKVNPVYYEALVLGYRDFGECIPGDRPPGKKEMLQLTLKLLSDQGYYPADSKHKPEMLLVLGWGTMDHSRGTALQFMGGDKLDIMWELEPLSILNSAQVLRRHMRGSTADFVLDCASGCLFIISIQAFDEEAALAGRTKLLWHTKVSCPADGLFMATTLKQMAREAAPYFGKETIRPVWTIAPPREGHVDFGELKVLGIIDPDKLPITDMDEGPDAVGPAAQRMEK